MKYVLIAALVGLVTGCSTQQAPQAAQKATKPPFTTRPEPSKPDPASGRNSVLQVPFDEAAKLVLLDIGRAYQIASISNGKPPKNAEELGAGRMKTKRDMQDRDVEVAYGVDPKKLGDVPGNFMIAWEKTPDNDGCRMVLMADFTTIKYVTQKEFDGMKKAKEK